MIKMLEHCFIQVPRTEIIEHAFACLKKASIKLHLLKIFAYCVTLSIHV